MTTITFPKNYSKVSINELGKLFSPPPKTKVDRIKLKGKKVKDRQGRETSFFTWDEKDYQY